MITDLLVTMDNDYTVINISKFFSEVGELITYLASEKSSYVNGAVIDITGGF